MVSVLGIVPILENDRLVTPHNQMRPGNERHALSECNTEIFPSQKEGEKRGRTKKPTVTAGAKKPGRKRKANKTSPINLERRPVVCGD